MYDETLPVAEGGSARHHPQTAGRSWALLFGRSILGLMFFMAGFWKVFQLGSLEHARRYFIEPYSSSFLPLWSLWITGTIIPVLELVSGALVILGLRTRLVLVVLGFILMLVTFGHLLKEPLFQFHTHVIPRLALLLFVLMLPADADRFSLDYLLKHRAKKQAELPGIS